MIIYLIGSLRNPSIPALANRLREKGHEVFDDWHAAGPNADDEWKRYSQEKGQDYRLALGDFAARHVFEFDYFHLNRSEAGVLALPAGRSGHLELGYLIGRGKRGFVLLDNPERWDVMYQFCEKIFFSEEELLNGL